MKRILLITICLLLTGVMGIAQAKKSTPSRPRAPKSGAPKSGAKKYGSTNCNAPSQLLQDGLALGSPDFISAGATNYYGGFFLAGHSYTAEVWDPYEADTGIYPALELFSGCAMGPSYLDIFSADPAVFYTFGDRISWISATSDFYQVVVPNTDTINGYDYFVRITDTTLHNPRWSSFSGFVTQYAFVNNTNIDISGTLTLTDNSGATFTANLTIPAGTESFQTTGGLGVPANDFGFADFAFIGPAGGITADAYFINSNATVIVPSTFAPRNYQH
jgi:hypothetical protein